MSEETEAGAEAVDFALVAYLEEGAWLVERIDSGTAADLDALTFQLRRYPGEGGALGLVSVDEDFFLLVRVLGAETRLLISDVSAATQWPLARSVVDSLDLPLPDEEDEEPAGDLDIVADLGLGARDMGAMLDEVDLYPDELLGDIAAQLGFGRRYDELVGVATTP